MFSGLKCYKQTLINIICNIYFSLHSQKIKINNKPKLIHLRTENVHTVNGFDGWITTPEDVSLFEWIPLAYCTPYLLKASDS